MKSIMAAATDASKEIRINVDKITKEN